MEKRLFLLDAYALIFRSYYAFIKNPRRTSKGFNTSAIFGFTNTLLDVLNNEKPTHIAVVFDPPTPTFRHEFFPEYKANRDETPQDIRDSVPYIKQLLSAMNIPVISYDGFEADDVIGTLSKMAEKRGFTTFMMTPDKDFGQLVSNAIFMFKPKRNGNESEIWGPKEVAENFGIQNPLQIIDLLALMGDASDNIPGAPGVGPKTAQKLIAEFGSVDKIIEHKAKLPGKVKDIVSNNIEKILLSKKLATIALDVPVEFDEEKLKTCKVDSEKIKELFSELEFKTLTDRVLRLNQTLPEITTSQNKPAETPIKKETKDDFQGNLFDLLFAPSQPEQFTDISLDGINTIDHNYILVDTPEKIKKLVGNLSKQKEFCFDTETTGIDPNNANLVGLAFCFKAHEAFYVPVPLKREDAMAVLAEFKDIFEDHKTLKIGQNLKYDILILKWYDINVKGILFDTMIAHYLLQPEQKHNLNYLAEAYLNYIMVPIEELIGKKGKNQTTMDKVDVEKVKDYSCEDADITFQIKQILEREILQSKMESLFFEIETPLIPVLAEMEKTGVVLNTEELGKYSETLKVEIKQLENDIYKLAGTTFNISSPKQLGDILFDKLKISSNNKKTKTKQYSTGEEILTQLKDKHPIIQKVLDFRSLTKLVSTYIDALPGLINPKTHKIHTSYNQAIVATGRLSSNNPNLQNIPIREERGREIRKSFVPSGENFTFFSADYSQIELRLMAHLSGDQNLINAFLQNEDVHTSTASKIYRISLNDVTKEMRYKAKTANFGIIYGISAFGLAERLNISRTEAKELIDNYFISYPGVKEFIEKSIALARTNGYVETLFGRRRYLPDINSNNSFVRSFAERNAINAPIQGTAADIIKIAMIRIHNKLENKSLKSKMILQVHDELDFDVYLPELDEVRNLVISEMENAVKLRVPLIAESGNGNSWLDAH